MGHGGYASPFDALTRVVMLGDGRDADLKTCNETLSRKWGDVSTSKQSPWKVLISDVVFH